MTAGAFSHTPPPSSSYLTSKEPRVVGVKSGNYIRRCNYYIFFFHNSDFTASLLNFRMLTDSPKNMILKGGVDGRSFIYKT